MSTAKEDFEEFFDQYLTTALWSSTYDDEDEEGKPMDSDFNTDNFTEDALDTLRAHAYSFWLRMWYYIDCELPKGTKTASDAGHDFWLTQNGHGAGFWDGDWKTYGEIFTNLSKCYPEINLDVDGDKVTAS